MKLVWIRRRMSTISDCTSYIGGHFDKYTECAYACVQTNKERRCIELGHEPFVPYPIFVDADGREYQAYQVAEMLATETVQ